MYGSFLAAYKKEKIHDDDDLAAFYLRIEWYFYSMWQQRRKCEVRGKQMKLLASDKIQGMDTYIKIVQYSQF